MKKILVFICLMFLSTSSYPFTIATYKAIRGMDDDMFALSLDNYMKGLYDGMALVISTNEISKEKYYMPSKFLSFCVPEELTFDIETFNQNLHKIVGDEMRRNQYHQHKADIGLPLFAGLQKTFPCE